MYAHMYTYTPHSHCSTPLYLGIREAECLRIRGKYSICCLICSITVHVLPIARGFVIHKRKTYQENDKTRDIDWLPKEREKESLCKGWRDLTLSETPQPERATLPTKIFGQCGLGTRGLFLIIRLHPEASSSGGCSVSKGCNRTLWWGAPQTLSALTPTENLVSSQCTLASIVKKKICIQISFLISVWFATLCK